MMAMNGFACGKIGWPLKHTKGHEKYKIQKGGHGSHGVTRIIPAGWNFAGKTGRTGRDFDRGKNIPQSF